ncbi:MAG: class I SAM-dependent methyltransferase [Sphingobacteriales bacterium]|nr:MAG: class I SAM-dependent methyltransferase [Sphingobacteriales bacterium]
MSVQEVVKTKRSSVMTQEDDIVDFHFKYTRAKDKLFLWAKDRFDLSQKAVCDIGSGYGHYLVHFGPGSYGLDISKTHIEFAEKLGVKVYQKDFMEDDLSDLPKADFVWTSATIEHLDSAHIFLRRIYNILNDNGVLLLESPVRPVSAFYRHIPGLKSLYNEHGDHVNFFTPDIFDWHFKRTGFKLEESFRWSVPLTNKLRLRNPTLTRHFPLNLFGDAYFAVCRKDPDWEYPARSIRKKAENLKGYVYKEGTL